MKILNLYAGIGGDRKIWAGETGKKGDGVATSILKGYREVFPHDQSIDWYAQKDFF